MYNIFAVSKEGWSYIGYSLGLSFLSTLFGFELFSILFFLSSLFFLYIYRDPEHKSVPFKENAIVTPVSGSVVSIEKVSEELFGTKVVVSSNYFSLGALYTPISGRVLECNFYKGTKLSQEASLYSKLNENVTIVFENDQKRRVKVEHISQQSFGDISLDISQNQIAKVASKYGFILNAKTNIYLPRDVQLNIGVGSKLIASQMLIGTFEK